MGRNREALRIKGLCLVCAGKNGPPEPGRTRCTACRLDNNARRRSEKGRKSKAEYVARWRAEGKCCDCGGKHGPLATEIRCQQCNDRCKTPAFRERCRAAQKRLRQRRREAGVCVQCGKERDRHTLVCSGCIVSTNRNNPAYRRALRAKVFAGYGGFRCACCGETEPDFLTLDHVNNDGKEHRKTVPPGYRLYKWLITNSFPPGFQVLCYNCNCGRGKRGREGACPHKRADQHAPEYMI